VGLVCITGAFTKLPKEEVLQEAATDLVKEVLECLVTESQLSLEDSKAVLNLSNTLRVAAKKNELRKLTDYACGLISNIIKNGNVLLPSALRSQVNEQMSKRLGNKEFWGHVKDMLREVAGDTSEEVLDLFLGPFVVKLCGKVLTFVFKSLHSDSVQESFKEKSSDVFTSTEFQSQLYHVVGSVLHACFVRCRTFKDSTNWNAYCDVLKRKCIREPEQNNQCHEIIVAILQLSQRQGGISPLRSGNI